MGCTIEWADDTHLIMGMVLEAPWTWVEFMSQMEQAFILIEKEGKPCATAVDVSRVGVLPKGNVLTYLTDIEKHIPSNVFASAVIGAPYMVSIFIDIVTKMRPRARRMAIFAKSREEAHDKILERYAKLKASTDSTS